jgi:hypothetical protein
MTQTVVPQFRITDAQQSIPFYVDGLGMVITDPDGNRLRFANPVAPAEENQHE